MTWKEQIISRILLLIAGIVCNDPVLKKELKDLSTHIHLYGGKEENTI